MDRNKLFVHQHFKYINRTKGELLILPDELLTMILEYLNQWDLLKFCLCSRLYKIIKPLLYENLVIYDPRKNKRVMMAHEIHQTVSVISIKNFIKMIHGYAFERELIKKITFLNCEVSLELVERFSDKLIKIIDQLENLRGFEDLTNVKFEIKCNETFQYVNFAKIDKLTISKFIEFNFKGDEIYNHLSKLDIMADDKTFQILKSHHNIKFSNLVELKIQSSNNQRIMVPNNLFLVENIETLIIDTSNIIFKDKKWDNLKTLELLYPSYDGYDSNFLLNIKKLNCLIVHSDSQIGPGLTRLNLQQLFYNCMPIEYNLVDIGQLIQPPEIIPNNLKNVIKSMDSLEMLGYNNQIYKVVKYDNLKELIPLLKNTAEVNTSFV